MLKISGFYLVKQTSLIPKKYDLGHSQYQNKRALLTDPIFRDGFAISHTKESLPDLTATNCIQIMREIQNTFFHENCHC